MSDKPGHDTLATTAYAVLADLLREQIVSGELAAGTHLTISGVARKYGVSHMPVREALQRLSGEGLLVMNPHRGARVRSIDAQFVRNIYDLRGVIEGMLGRLSVAHLREADLEQGFCIHRALCEAVRNEDVPEVLDLNREFHHLIYRRSGNPEAVALFEQYSALIASIRRRYGFSPQRLIDITVQHERILEMMRQTETSEIEELLRTHCEGARNDLLQRMSSQAGVT
ncbi:MAG: GntR family transcriptional regulator [Limnochordia bacterium]|jgi:DNA-binding GntR family transcriptional regulator